MALDEIRRHFSSKSPDRAPDEAPDELEDTRKYMVRETLDLLGDASQDSAIPEAAEARAFLNSRLPSFTLPEIYFIYDMLVQTGRTPHGTRRVHDPAKAVRETVRIYHALRPEAGRQAFQLNKTGATLRLLTTPEGVVFRHEMPRFGADAWQEASSIVPVAPIIKVKEDPSVQKGGHESGETRTIYSRFCGMVVGVTMDIFSREYPRLAQEIDRQRTDIIETLLRNRVSHRHLHSGNFTVEYIRRDALRDFAKEKGISAENDDQLRMPELINALPYHQDDFIFDPADFIRHQDTFIPVVRVIDFDLASIQEPDLPLADMVKEEGFEHYFTPDEIAQIRERLGVTDDPPKQD
jgi:hypothetical protein